MTWTYSGNPSASDRDAVRFHVGDTDTTDQLVTDEEIAYALTQQPSIELAAALICDAIAAKFTREADRRVGDVSLSASQQAEAYRTKARDLRTSGYSLALPSFGGRSISEKETLDSDSDAVQPSFRVGQDDHPGIPSERQYSPYTVYEDI